LAIETLLDTLGGHTSRAYGIDLDTTSGRARWLCVARLASERDAEETKRAAYARLDAEVGAEPSALAAADPERVARCLAAAGLRRPEPIAYGLCRAARALAETFDADLERLAAGCDDLEQLGGRLAALAPGFGRATVLRFLRPLRGVWSAARETPLADTARAAATHLGLIGDDDDLEGEPSALQRALAERAPGVSFADAEGALERLGALACRAGRTQRCPLADACPARSGAAQFR
jgi:endonuclease III